MRRTQELLARVRLTENERRAAEYDLVLGERVADAILDTAAALSSAMQALDRALRAVTGFRSAG